MNRPQVFTPLQRPGRWLAGMAVLLWASQWVSAQEPPAATPTEASPGTAGTSLPPVTPDNATVAPTSTSTKPAAPRKPAPHRDTPPRWSDLTHEQQRALQPLAHSWATLSELHKRKWLVLSQNFSELPAQEQQKLQERMSDWTSLTAQERAQARLHFAEVQQLPGDERRAKWEAYQALTPEQRRKLADDILLVPPRGAALASRPVAASKLTQPPAVKPDQVLQPRIDTDQVHPKTLLPHFLQGTSTR